MTAAVPRAPGTRPYHCGACGAEGHSARACLTVERVARPREERRQRILSLIVAEKARRDTIATMLAEGCSFVEIGEALGVNYKGPAHTTRIDPELQAIYEAATELRKARTREKMSAAHSRT